MPDIFVDSPSKVNPKLAPSHKILTAFAAYPQGVHFETQEEKEEIIFLLRRHIITNFFWVATAVILLFAPFLIFPSLSFLVPFKIPLNFMIIGTIIWYSLSASFVFMNFLSWYFNVYILTDQRVVDVDFYNLTYKKIASANLNRIQDVTIRSGGVVRTIFDFADVYIQTAGTEPNFQFEAVPNPDLVAQEILKMTEDLKNTV